MAMAAAKGGGAIIIIGIGIIIGMGMCMGRVVKAAGEPTELPPPPARGGLSASSANVTPRLLLPLRSQRMHTVVARDVPAGVLAIGQLALVTPHEGVVDTDYLAWYLNHPRTRERLVGAMMGSSLQFLTMRSVNEFDVDLPDFATQRGIGRVATLSGRITLLEQRLSSARQQLTDALATAALDRAITTRRTRA